MRVGEVPGPYSAADIVFSRQCSSPKLGTRDVHHISHGPEHARAADLIKRVFRARVAERAYEHMFDKGTCFTQMKLYGELKGSGTASLNKISQGFMGRSQTSAWPVVCRRTGVQKGCRAVALVIQTSKQLSARYQWPTVHFIQLGFEPGRYWVEVQYGCR